MNFEMLSSIITLSILVPYKWKTKLTDLNASTKIISQQQNTRNDT